jgi:PAS domain S-box-containing protein
VWADLLEGWQALWELSTPEESIVYILERLRRETASSRACFMQWLEDERVLANRFCVGAPAEAIANLRVRLGEGIVGLVAQSRQPQVWPGATAEPALAGHSLCFDPSATILCVPAHTDTSLWGVVCLERPGRDRPFTPEEVIFSRLLTGGLALALHAMHLLGLVESKEQFISQITESIPTSILVVDRYMRITFANRNFLEKARREWRATAGRKIEEVFPRVLVEYARLDQKIRDVFRTGLPMEGEKLAYRAPGLTTRIYYYNIIPLKAHNAVENVMLLLNDITEREQLGAEVHKAERHLASVVECANDLVVSVDPEGHILTWNRAAEKVSGFQAEQVRGRKLSELCVEDRRPAMREMLEKAARGKGVQNTEAHLLTAGGQEIPIAWSGSPIWDDAGAAIGMVAVGRDLTEQRRLQAQLIQSAKMASMGVLAGGIAHELRNPLGIISAGAQLLLENPGDAGFRAECTEKICAAAQRASTIIENLLKFARPEKQRMQIIDVRGVIEDTLAVVANQLALHKVALQKQIGESLPRVWANPELLQQVFTNLILNACNAMPQGGRLRVIVRSAGGAGVEITFGDSGCGIPQENLSRIFDPFFTTMPIGKGVGLGLAISHSIIQQHQGTIEVESQLGKGSAFTIHLPGPADARERHV